MKLPKVLKKGDTLAFVSPASFCPDHKLIDLSKQYFESRGYKIREYGSCRSEYGYLSGDDSIRADDINSAFADPEVDAIICIRGGYGTPRILDRLDYKMIAKHPKLLMGFSDITGLIIALYAKCGLVTLHSPMPTTCMAGDFDPYSKDCFLRAMESCALGKIPLPEKAELEGINGGRAEGVLIGGNLSLISALMGTGYMFDPTDKVIFIEEVGEAAYRVDRMLTNLRLAGVFDKCRAVVFGAFTACGASDDGYSVDDAIRDIVVPCGKPILKGFPAGHTLHNASLPMGVRVRVDADNNTLEYISEHLERA